MVNEQNTLNIIESGAFSGFD